MEILLFVQTSHQSVFSRVWRTVAAALEEPMQTTLPEAVLPFSSSLSHSYSQCLISLCHIAVVPGEGWHFAAVSLLLEAPPLQDAKGERERCARSLDSGRVANFFLRGTHSNPRLSGVLCTAFAEYPDFVALVTNYLLLQASGEIGCGNAPFLSCVFLSRTRFFFFVYMMMTTVHFSSARILFLYIFEGLPQNSGSSSPNCGSHHIHKEKKKA